MQKTYVIYKVENKINGKLYIGKTYNLKQRKKQHISSMEDDLPFHRALKKYGVNNFEWTIIDYAETDSEIRQKEIYWIKTLNTCIYFKESNGYNITLGGDGGTSWNSRPVVQFDLNGKYVDEYISSSHAASITGIHRHDISNCAYHMVQRAGDYMWRFKDECPHKNIEPYRRKESVRKRSVIQLDLDGFVVNIFDSVTSASKLTNTRRSNISGCLTNKADRVNGYQWIYADDYDVSKDYKYKGIKEGKGIYQLDDDMNIINHFNNCSEAARYLNEPDKVHKQIFKALHTNNRCRGFRWMKVDEYNSNYANTEITQ